VYKTSVSLLPLFLFFLLHQHIIFITSINLLSLLHSISYFDHNLYSILARKTFIQQQPSSLFTSTPNMLSFIKFAALVGPFNASSYAQTLDIATTTSSGLPSTITTSLHVPSEFLEFWGGYAGSVVAAYVDRTTFAFGCGSSCLTAAIWAVS